MNPITLKMMAKVKQEEFLREAERLRILNSVHEDNRSESMIKIAYDLILFGLVGFLVFWLILAV